MTAAERTRRYRERKRRGLMPLLLDVDEVALVEMLVAVRMLPADQIDDRAAVRAAAEKWISVATSPKVYESVTLSRHELLRAAILRKIA